MNIGIFAKSFGRGQLKLEEIVKDIPAASIKKMQPGRVEITDGTVYRVFSEMSWDKARGAEFTKIYLEANLNDEAYFFARSRVRGEETRIEYFP